MITVMCWNAVKIHWRSIDRITEKALAEHQPLDSALLAEPAPVPADMPLSELISLVAQAPCAVPVIGEDSSYIGIISKAMLLQALDKETPNE